MRGVSAGILIILALAAAAPAAPVPALYEAKASLAGIVLPDDLVEIGAQVEEDQPLVFVRTGLTGRKDVAARSPWKGVVREVLVRPGEQVRPGDVLVRIEPR